MASIRDPNLTSAETVASSELKPGSAGAAGSAASQPSTTGSHHDDDGRFVPGTLLNGRYRVSGLLGRGGMGEVYRATDLTLGQSVALKFLPETAGGNVRLLERFHAEVRVARQVSHPNVCRVHDIGEVDGSPFISMEYVDGEDLASLLQRIGRLPSSKALETARKICAGLAAAHDKGVIHRDLKPQNIMLNKRGEVVIMDFGLAAVADTLTGAEARNGTPAYMSPESLKGLEATARSDIYALGAVLYELFTGRRPFEARTVQQMIDLQEAGQVTSIVELASDADAATDAIIRRCLDSNPARRPASALSVSAALPGGDPLAAALAAGETPSPDVVAGAGGHSCLATRWAIVCASVIAACLIAAPFVRSQRLAMMQAPFKHPPEVLAAKAREMAVTFGYPTDPGDVAGSFSNRIGLLAYLGGRRNNPDWPAWMRGEAPISYVVREAPSFMVAWPAGGLTSMNPPPLVPGMTSIELDAHGRLRGFSGVPYGRPPAIPVVDPEAVFRAAGLDPGRFTEIEPRSLPQSATDRMRAWKGSHPAIPDLPLVLEIGWWKSQITWVKLVWPWMNELGDSANATGTPFAPIRFLVLVATISGSGIFALLMARRNWKLGRVDKRGAARLAYAQLLLAAIDWAGRVHGAPHGVMFDLFLNALSLWLFSAAVMWLMYVALEPILRSRWPQSIVSWSRMLTGRFFDPVVSADILLGIMLGTAMWIVSQTVMQASGPLDTTSLQGLYGARMWVAILPGQILQAIRVGMFGLLGLFGLRILLRKDWLAVPVAALLFATVEQSLLNTIDWQFRYAMYVIVYAALAYVVLRRGLVVTISLIVSSNMMNLILIGTDLSPWYTSTGFATLGLLIGITALVFWKSLGPRGSAMSNSSATVGSHG